MNARPVSLSLALVPFLLFFGGCATGGSSEGTPTAPPTTALTSSDRQGAAEDAEELSFEESLYFDEDPATERIITYDPFEGFNRAMFSFNDAAFRYVLTPVGRGYDAVVPDLAQKGIGNFFYNLGAPARMVSALLQGKPKLAGQELGGFLANSTVGIGGLLRPSDEIFEEPLPEEDLGQTFGSWGIEQGPYLVLPLLGPTTLRDGVGRVGEIWLSPYHYMKDEDLTYSLRLLELTNELPGLSEQYEDMREASVDPYTALRDAYLKYRAQAVSQ
jgi:phospholipid-binding lipoprotein MlaA